MRDHCTEQELWAHHILDAVRCGIPVAPDAVTRALWILGDLEVVNG